MRTETNKAQRRITSVVDVPGTPERQFQLTVSSSHDRERKELRRTIYRSIVYRTSTHGYIPDTYPDGVRGYICTPIARYSLSALQAWHDAALSALDIDELTIWASEARER